MKIRSPRGATHAYALGSHYEAFWMRRGRQVFEFNPYRNEWLLTSKAPSFLEPFKRLNIFEMHPDTAETLTHQSPTDASQRLAFCRAGE